MNSIIQAHISKTDLANFFEKLTEDEVKTELNKLIQFNSTTNKLESVTNAGLYFQGGLVKSNAMAFLTELYNDIYNTNYNWL